MIRFSFICFSFFILLGCRNSYKEENGTKQIDWSKAKKWKNEFAKGFTVEEYEKYYRITITDPQTNKEYGKFVLYPEKEEKPDISEGETAIKYPVKSFASVSSTHLPFLKLLNVENTLTGYAGQNFVVSEEFKKLFKEKNIPELGADNAIYTEKLIELFPDVFMVYPFGSLNFSKIEAAKIPVFYNTEYLELHPLGKTEWLKVFGILFNKTDEAEKIFDDISKRYINIANAISKSTGDKPIVFTGLNFSGTWHVPGGKSFQAQFLKDAGVNYVWENDPNNNSLSLPAETVIEKCIDADYWLIVSTEKPDFSLDDLIRMDPNYSYFKAVKNKNIIFCNSGVKDYFGEAIVEPDVILNELWYFLRYKDYPMPSSGETDVTFTNNYFEILQ
jgi:iron complex transport system substrate-binding protein